jgi:hypothetical protein
MKGVTRLASREGDAGNLTLPRVSPASHPGAVVLTGGRPGAVDLTGAMGG